MVEIEGNTPKVSNPEKTDTNILRFIAIALIINSHLDEYYPISYVGTGGAIGNSLFFFVSSFGLLLGEKRNPKGFLDWYSKRVKRIYPSFWLAFTFIIIPMKILNKSIDLENLLKLLGNFFYPPSVFWFLQALMIFYVLIYFVIKNYNIRKVYYLGVIICMIYVYLYVNCVDLSKWSVEDGYIQLVFYFGMFVFGTFIADKTNRVVYAGPIDFVGLVVFVGGIYLHKFLMLQDMLMSLQFVQQLFLFPAVYYFLKISRSELIQKKIMNVWFISIIVNYISNITLEMYIAHSVLNPQILKLGLVFPVNIFVNIGTTVILAGLIKYSGKLLVLKAEKFM